MPDWHTIDGWFSDEDAGALSAILARMPKGGTTAHIGIFAGRHLASCADVIRERQLSVLAVDTWRGSGNTGQGECLGDASWAAMAIQYGMVLVGFGLNRLVTSATQDSLTVARRCREQGQTFDLVFLDGDHSYEAVYNDIEAWAPLVKPGGLICGHDWGDPCWPGVEQAAREMLPGVVGLTDSRVWVWKKPAEVEAAALQHLVVRE